MAAKPIPSSDDEQNFGFLSSVDYADAADTVDIKLRAERCETSISPGSASGRHATGATRIPSIFDTTAPSTDRVSRRLFVCMAAYAIALTLLFLG